MVAKMFEMIFTGLSEKNCPIYTDVLYRIWTVIWYENVAEKRHLEADWHPLVLPKLLRLGDAYMQQ